jgi:hypothetical protein
VATLNAAMKQYLNRGPTERPRPEGNVEKQRMSTMSFGKGSSLHDSGERRAPGSRTRLPSTFPPVTSPHGASAHKPANNRAPNVFLRANVAAGVRLGAVDLAAEFVNVGGLDGTVTGGIDNRFFHTLAVGLSTRGTDQFRIGTVFPLDKAFRGEIWILSLGYQHTMN